MSLILLGSKHDALGHCSEGFRINQQSQNIVYLSAELNRLCRIRG